MTTPRPKNGFRQNRRTKMGKRADLGGLFVRSAWEANYARFLNWLQARGEIARWEYEADTFEFAGIKRGTRFYTPDFKVFTTDGHVEYHEVKGWMTPKSVIQLKRMAKYHPVVKIVLIDSVYYADLKKKIARLIPNWE